MQRLFVDTSAWFAYTNSKDPDHNAVRKVLHTFQGRLVTSNYVIDETISLCLYRLSHKAAVAVGDVLFNAVEIDSIRITGDDERDSYQLLCQRPDQRYSFTDCTSFILMRRLALDTALALDDDFRREGFQVVP